MIALLCWLVCVGVAERVFSPDVKVLKEELQSDVYEANQNQLLILQYNE